LTIVAVLIVCGIGLAYYSDPNFQMGETEGNVTVTDMAGRTITIPNNVQKVIAASPTMTAMVYMLNPDKLAGLNYQWTDSEIKYVNNEYRSLPIVGGWFGTQEGNYEEIISFGPNIIIQDIRGVGDLTMIIDRQEKFGTLPVIGVIDNLDITEIEYSIDFVGKMLGEEAKAGQLIDLAHEYLDKANTISNSIPDNEKKRVYYVRENEGLGTAPEGSVHTQIVELVGGKNVVDLQTGNNLLSRIDVSMEQVIKWNPEIIITVDESFYENVYTDPRWSNIKAVKEKQVYLSPQSPFKWIDKPFGANTIIGILWTGKVIYPEKYTDINLKEEVKSFYKEYFHYDLSDNEVKDILESSGLKEENM